MQEKSAPRSSGLTYFIRIWKYQKRFPGLLLLIALCVVTSAAFQIYLPFAYKKLIDEALAKNNIQLAVIILSVISTMFILKVIATWVQTRLTLRLSLFISNILKLSLFDAALRGGGAGSPIEKEASFSGRFNRDVVQLETLMTSSQWGILLQLVMFSSGALFLFQFDWKMAILSLSLLPLMLMLPKFFERRASSFSAEKKKEEAKLPIYIKEAVTHQDLIRILRLESSNRKKLNALLKRARQSVLGYYENDSLSKSVVTLDIDAVNLAILISGVYLVLSERLSTGGLFGFLALFRIVSSTFFSLRREYVLLRQGINALNAVEAFISSPPKRTPKKFLEMPPIRKSISFKDVGLRIGDKDLLRHINLDVKAGTSLAIVGSSGSGKSMLMRLLFRELSPTSGEIFFDDVPMKDISSKALVSQFGVVSQDPKLFEATIKENIALGQQGVSDERIELAARNAGLYEEIGDFPQGFDSQPNKDGFQLSGGQKQRLTIARALVGDPPILCLDEVTSALDPFADEAVEEALNRLAGSRTIISVTHRLKSAVFADQIAVLNKGEIIELGNHQTLLNAKGLYSRMWEKQNGFVMNRAERTMAVKPGWLRTIPLFSTLSDETLQSLAQEFLFEREEPGAVVVKQGEPGDKIYIIASGTAEISTTDSKSGEKVVRALLTDGDFFGEIALLHDVPRTATVTAKTICLLLSLHRQQFHRFLNEAPANVKEEIKKKAAVRMGELGITVPTQK